MKTVWDEGLGEGSSSWSLSPRKKYGCAPGDRPLSRSLTLAANWRCWQLGGSLIPASKTRVAYSMAPCVSLLPLKVPEGETIAMKRIVLVFLLAAIVAFPLVPMCSGCRSSGEPSAGEPGTPGGVPAGLPETLPVRVTAIAAGRHSAYALTENGTVWAWGGNEERQLGNGVPYCQHVPVQVTALTGVKAVATRGRFTIQGYKPGLGYTCAVASDGTVWEWGKHLWSDPDSWEPGSTPRKLSGVSDVRAVAVSSLAGVALRSDGTVWSWEPLSVWSRFAPKSLPSQVEGLSGVIVIAAGICSSYALKDDGSVWAWGWNGEGQLGNGSEKDSEVPVKVRGLSEIVAIAAAGGNAYALASDGTTWAWGNGQQLGNGTDDSSSVPVKVSGLTGVKAIAAGVYTAYALTADGRVWGWGDNYDGQLGAAFADSTALTPVEITGLANVVGLAAGDRVAYAVTQDGSVWAWGTNGDGELGDASDVPSRSQPGKVTLPGPVTDVVSDGGSAFALTTGGQLWAWGVDGCGQLGLGSLVYSATPLRVQGLEGVKAIAAGTSAACALRSDGTVWRWGEDVSEIHPSPTQVPEMTRIVAVGASGEAFYGLRADGVVLAGGMIPEPDSRGSRHGGEVETIATLKGASAMAAGGEGFYVLKSDGTVWAWGCNYRGQLGNGGVEVSLVPVQVAGLSEVKAIAAGLSCAYALKSDGSVWAWGANLLGELGTGTSSEDPNPVPQRIAGLPPLSGIMAGAVAGFGFTAEGKTWVWGYHQGAVAAPAETACLENAGAVTDSARRFYPAADDPSRSCSVYFLKPDGSVWAWGPNQFGQLGDGTTAASDTPVQVGRGILGSP